MKQTYSHKWDVFDKCQRCGIERRKSKIFNPQKGYFESSIEFKLNNEWTNKYIECKNKTI